MNTTLEKHKTLIDRLLERSRENKLAWEETMYKGTFQCPLSPAHAVRIAERDHEWSLTLVNAEGRMVEDIDPAVIDEALACNDLEYTKKTAELYRLASRKAMKAEEALDEVLAALDGDSSQAKLMMGIPCPNCGRVIVVRVLPGGTRPVTCDHCETRMTVTRLEGAKYKVSGVVTPPP